MWQKKRLEIMQRDEYSCVSCGDDQKTLNVHHKTYRKGADPWEYEDDNFVTLCEECHKDMHEIHNKIKMQCSTVDMAHELAEIATHCSPLEITELLLISYAANGVLEFYITKPMIEARVRLVENYLRSVNAGLSAIKSRYNLNQ